MALLQKFGNNGLHFSRSSMLTKKATIFLDDGLYRKILTYRQGLLSQ